MKFSDVKQDLMIPRAARRTAWDWYKRVIAYKDNVGFAMERKPTADNFYVELEIVPWVPTQEDLVAEDWVVIT